MLAHMPPGGVTEAEYSCQDPSRGEEWRGKEGGRYPGCPLCWSQPTVAIGVEWQMRENKLSLLAHIWEGELAGLKIKGYEGKRRIRTCF